MSNTLLERLQKSRETVLPFGPEASKQSLIISRPSELDMSEFRIQYPELFHKLNKEIVSEETGETAVKEVLLVPKPAADYLFRRCVVGWKNVTELSLDIPGGTDEAAPFDIDLFMYWIADKIDYVQDIYIGIISSYNANKTRIADALGEASAGSNS